MNSGVSSPLLFNQSFKSFIFDLRNFDLCLVVEFTEMIYKNQNGIEEEATI